MTDDSEASDFTDPIDLFETLPRESTLASRVAGQIEQLILDGHLKPGDRLPSERQLADQFGVSRTVVREAVRSLAAKNLLHVQAGSGTIVSTPSAESVAQTMSLFLRVGQLELDYDKVHEVRRALEIAIAGAAAERRTPADIAAMEEILQQARRIRGNRDEFAANDVAFHAALAQATHNELYILLLDSVADIMLQVRQMAFDVPDMPTRALAHHADILTEVKAGDADAARDAMRGHLIESENTMREAWALQSGRHPKH